MEGEKVDVKWGTKWYPATILKQINEEEVEVEFINHDYEPEIVSISYQIRKLSKSAQILSLSNLLGHLIVNVSKVSSKIS